MSKGSMKFLYTATGLAGMAAMALMNPALVTAQEGKRAEAATEINIQKQVVQLSGHIGVGYLSGESQETVYEAETGQKISELIWKLDNVFMFNIGGSVSPKPWLTFNGDFWIKLNDGNGYMDDYDYLLYNYEYTHWSHSDVDLTTGYMIDVSTALTFYEYGETAFSGLIGYKRDSWEWEASGGSYVYSSYYLYDTVGTLPNGKVITYSQWYDVPYIGVAFRSKLTDWTFTGRAIFSPYAMAGDEDTHHLRNLKFEEDFDPTTMYAIDFGAAYHFTPKLSLLGNVHYQQYMEAEGTTTITDQTTGAKYYYGGDAAGTDHKSSLFSLTLLYNF